MENAGPGFWVAGSQGPGKRGVGWKMQGPGGKRGVWWKTWGLVENAESGGKRGV